MLQKLLNLSIYGKHFCGVEHISKNGVEVIHGLLLQQQKNELSIVSEFKTNDVSDLKNSIKEKQHIFVTINNDNVLFKTLQGEYDAQKALPIAFPNLKIEDFYYELYAANDVTYIAICRKDTVKNILHQYDSLPYSVVGFSLGNLGIVQLNGFTKEATIQTSNGRITFADTVVSGINISNIETSSFTVNDLKLSNFSMLSLAGILKSYLNQSLTTTNFSDLTNQFKNNFKHTRIFDLGLKFGLGLIFISLLTSFLFFSHYSSNIKEESSALTVNKSQKNTLLKLSEEVAKKEKLLNDFSLVSSRSSWHIDQLGQIVPTSVLLTELQWQPLTKTVKEDTQIETRKQIILIKGTSNNSQDFSDWMNILEKKEWIDNISINSYGTDKQNMPAFELKIEFKQ